MDSNKKPLPPSMWGRRKAAEESKSNRITIRFTDEQMALIIRRAERLNISLAGYCRAILMGKSPPDKSEEQRHFQRVASGEANNLRQIAREMHQRGLTGDLLNRIEAVIARIEAA